MMSAFKSKEMAHDPKLRNPDQKRSEVPAEGVIDISIPASHHMSVGVLGNERAHDSLAPMGQSEICEQGMMLTEARM